MTRQEREKRKQEARDLHHRADIIEREVADDIRREKERALAMIVEEFKLNDDHKKLLKEMEFKFYPHGGDLVFIGVDGKRPFGNSSIGHDVARILGWQLPNDGLSNEQQKRVERLYQELPLALNEILKSL